MEVIGMVGALILAGFSSGAREALRALDTKEQFQAAKSDENSSQEDELQWWRQRRRGVLMVLKVGHRLGLILATTLAVVMATSIFGAELPSLAALIAILTVGGVLLGDVIPSTMARSHPQQYALWALRFLRLPYLILYPVTKLLLLSRGLVRRVVGEDQILTESFDAASVLRSIFAGEKPHLEQRRRLLRSVTGSSGTVVREVMVPRTDMVTISKDMELSEILLTLLECGHSRIPVHGETHDEIIGLFYAKDVIQFVASGEEFDIDEFLRRPYFVPETKQITELLSEFQRKRIHMAVVVDEFGGTAGLITLEDIIEEFFGDIQDEYDVEPSQLIELTATSVLADARIGIDELEEYFEIEFPDRDDYDSLGGFLLCRLGNVPEPGAEVRWESLLFRIIDADAKRIDTVEIEILASSGEEAEMVS